jgi:hypothetical protein
MQIIYSVITVSNTHQLAMPSLIANKKTSRDWHLLGYRETLQRVVVGKARTHTCPAYGLGRLTVQTYLGSWGSANEKNQKRERIGGSSGRRGDSVDVYLSTIPFLNDTLESVRTAHFKYNLCSSTLSQRHTPEHMLVFRQRPIYGSQLLLLMVAEGRKPSGLLTLTYNRTACAVPL